MNHQYVPKLINIGSCQNVVVDSVRNSGIYTKYDSVKILYALSYDESELNGVVIIEIIGCGFKKCLTYLSSYEYFMDVLKDGCKTIPTTESIRIHRIVDEIQDHMETYHNVINTSNVDFDEIDEKFVSDGGDRFFVGEVFKANPNFCKHSVDDKNPWKSLFINLNSHLIRMENEGYDFI